METQRTAGVFHDFSGLSQLKAEARQDENAALKEVAQQFESLFLGMMLKSMRAASLGEGLMDSDQSNFYRDMYDQQLATDLGQSGSLNLSDLIVRQLGKQTGAATDAVQQLDDVQRDNPQHTWSAAQLSLLHDQP